MPSIPLAQVLACPNLPSLPTAAVEVLTLAGKPNVKLDQIAGAIQNDPALCARILKTVNSSYYGLSQPCPTITRALAYLGLHSVKSLVLGFSLVDWSRSADCEAMLKDYWGCCILSAAVSRRLATLTKLTDPEEAFLAALVQDIGMLAIHWAIGGSANDAFSQPRGGHVGLAKYCVEELGVDHAEVGAALAKRWRFPQEFADAVRQHHAPLDTLASAHALVRIVAAANHIVAGVQGSDPSRAFHDLRGPIAALLKTDVNSIDSVVTGAVEDAREMVRLLRVSTQPFPDMASIMAMAEEAHIRHHLDLARETQQLKQSNTELLKQSRTDSLTGVANRRHFDNELATHFEHAKRVNRTLALFIIDIDRFKVLNDTFGHSAGDAVLTAVAARIAEAASRPAAAFRFGGEEFAVICPGLNRNDAAALAESIRAHIAADLFEIADHNGVISSVPVTASIGVALHEQPPGVRFGNSQLLIQAADKALYAAKQGGRNCVRIFNVKAPATA